MERTQQNKSYTNENIQSSSDTSTLAQPPTKDLQPYHTLSVLLFNEILKPIYYPTQESTVDIPKTPERTVEILTTLQSESDKKKEPITKAVIEFTHIGIYLAKTVQACEQHKQTASEDDKVQWDKAINIAESLISRYQHEVELQLSNETEPPTEKVDELTLKTPAAAAAKPPAAEPAAAEDSGGPPQFEFPKPGDDGAVENILSEKKFIITGPIPELQGNIPKQHSNVPDGRDVLKGVIKQFGGKMTTSMNQAGKLCCVLLLHMCGVLFLDIIILPFILSY